MSVSPVEVLTTIARSAVRAGQYTAVEEALWGMAIEEARRKIAHYRQRIRHFERKYGMDFETFSAGLAGKATIPEEDDWMAWRAAQGMLSDWERVHRELIANASSGS